MLRSANPPAHFVIKVVSVDVEALSSLPTVGAPEAEDPCAIILCEALLAHSLFAARSLNRLLLVHVVVLPA